MVDHITDIPLPGRAFASPRAEATGRAAEVALPTFVAGPENRLVAAAVGRLLACASPAPSAADPDPPPRFATPSVWALCGATGNGKTHLARGLVHHWQTHRGPDSAEYLTANDFRRRLTDALGRDAILPFRQTLRSHELLAIDDLHRLPKDRYLQEELRYTIDALANSGGTLVVTSTRPVPALGNLSDELRSRLSAGLLLQLASPGSVARQRLLEQIAAALGRPLPQAWARQLSHGITGTASDLFGAMFELLASRPRQLAGDESWVREYLARRAARRPTLRQIIAVVARYSRVPQKVLKSRSRKQAAVSARAVVVYLARELAGANYERIGQALGGRDHTTMIHSYRKVQRELQCRASTRQVVDDLRSLLLSNY